MVLPQRYYTTNNGRTTLSSQISDSATTMVVDSVAKLPSDKFPYFLTIDGDNGFMEVIKVTEATGTTLTIERAQSGTTAYLHAADALVELMIMSEHIENAWDGIEMFRFYTITLPISISDAEVGDITYVEYDHSEEDVDDNVGIKAIFEDNPMPSITGLDGFVVTPVLDGTNGSKFVLKIEYVGTENIEQIPISGGNVNVEVITGTGSAEGTITRTGVLA